MRVGIWLVMNGWMDGWMVIWCLLDTLLDFRDVELHAALFALYLLYRVYLSYLLISKNSRFFKSQPLSLHHQVRGYLDTVATSSSLSYRVRFSLCRFRETGILFFVVFKRGPPSCPLLTSEFAPCGLQE